MTPSTNRSCASFAQPSPLELRDAEPQYRSNATRVIGEITQTDAGKAVMHVGSRPLPSVPICTPRGGCRRDGCARTAVLSRRNADPQPPPHRPPQDQIQGCQPKGRPGCTRSSRTPDHARLRRFGHPGVGRAMLDAGLGRHDPEPHHLETSPPTAAAPEATSRDPCPPPRSRAARIRRPRGDVRPRLSVAGGERRRDLRSCSEASWATTRILSPRMCARLCSTPRSRSRQSELPLVTAA